MPINERVPNFVTPGQTYRIATGSTVVLPCRITEPGECIAEVNARFCIYYPRLDDVITNFPDLLRNTTPQSENHVRDLLKREKFWRFHALNRLHLTRLQFVEVMQHLYVTNCITVPCLNVPIRKFRL